MHPDAATKYEATPITCFACAARDAETRQAAEARSSHRIGPAGFDGLYFAVTERTGG